jgi:hypothetical protein
MDWDYNNSKFCATGCHKTVLHKVKNFTVEGLSGSIVYCTKCGEISIVTMKIDVHYEVKEKKP